MPDVATSLHLHNLHELMILAPLRQGFVEQEERRVSYATRLQVLLNLLFRPAQSTAEKTLLPALHFGENLRNLYHFNYGVVDRLQASELILNATFDSSWEAYFHNLVDNVGPFLDAVFFHCEGFKGRSCADGYEAFADFIRENQVQTGMLYTATPELTADDLRLLRKYARGDGLKTPLPSLKEQIALDKKAWMARYESEEWQGEQEYARLRLQSITQFFLSVWEARKLFTPQEKIDHRNAQDFFDNAARFLVDAVVDEVTFIGGTINAVVIDGKPLPIAILKQLLLAGATDAECEAWIESMLTPASEVGPKARSNVAPIPLPEKPSDFSNVQRGIIERRESNAALLSFLRLPKKDVAPFLDRLREGLFPNTDKMTVNVGFTYAGLRRLGLGDETRELLPKEFQEGMEQRAGVLGDVGWPNHPDYWRPIGKDGWFSMSSIDLVVVFHFQDATAGSSIVDEARGLLRTWIDHEPEACLVHSEFVDRTSLEPFGFQPVKDPHHNQPEIKLDKGTTGDSPLEGAAENGYDNRIAPGNLILGHHDHRGEVASIASGKDISSDLFKDGTFLVIRKLAQNVVSYRRTQAENKDLESEAATLGTHVEHPTRSYEKDPEKSFPLNTHLRRANPRLKDVPRLVRQSYTYGDSSRDNAASDRASERGHMFMCYCASIGQQYEVIQRWINGGNSTGLLSSDREVVAGQHVARPKSSGADMERPHVPSVTLRWGMYLFVPSRHALERLREIAESESSEFVAKLEQAENKRQVQRGKALLKQLDAVCDPRLAQQSWKQLFEEATSGRDARAVWAAIREAGGQKDTPYGLLLGSRDDVKKVLENTGDLYSVREYRERFLNTAGDFYLGLDACPAGRTASPLPGLSSYAVLAQANVAANRVLSSEAARTSAARFASDFVRRDGRRSATDSHARITERLDVKQLVEHVIGKICGEYIGIPTSVADKEQFHEFLHYFVVITRYSSFPYPEKWVAERAAEAGQALLKAYGEDSSQWTGALKAKLIEDKYGSPEAIRSALIIANIGFVPPAISMMTGMLLKWINNGDIQRPHLREPEGARSAILEEMTTDATFTTIYRTKLEPDGNGEPSPGTYVVVGHQSVYTQARRSAEANPQRWMFGGTYASPHPGVSRGAHACPMQAQALEIMIGVTTALANYVHLRAQNDCALVRLSPFAYELEKVVRRLPGAYPTTTTS
jgi:hypothetical protein